MGVKRYWFRPQKYGLGAIPNTWEGWSFVAAFVAVISGLGLWLASEIPPPSDRVVMYALAVVVVALAFVCVCRRKTDGPWRRCWGEEEWARGAPVPSPDR
jgi:hypothetical protein